ncbi:alpha/beta fold hydrolase [Paenibacillus septentrionalis]
MALQTLVFTIFWRLIRSELGVDKDKQQVLSVLKSVKERDFSQDLLHLQQVRLLLVGEKDAIHVKAAKFIGQRFPNSEIKIIQNAGHEINEDQPIALANEIINLD